MFNAINRIVIVTVAALIAALMPAVAPAQVSSARNIDCGPKESTNVTGATTSINCVVRGPDGGPVASESVTFTEDGPGEIITPTEVLTDEQGRARVDVSSPDPGDQTVTATLTAASEGEPDLDECDRPADDPPGAPAGNCSDSVVVTWEESTPECSDGVDNDGDGRIDHPDDPGCTSPDDGSEFPNPLIKIPTRITIRHGSPFHGKVSSEKARCKRNRKVVLKKVRKGKDRTIGADRTNRRGKWRIDHGRATGRFYAIARVHRFSTTLERFRCDKKASAKKRVRS